MGRRDRERAGECRCHICSCHSLAGLESMGTHRSSNGLQGASQSALHLSICEAREALHGSEWIASEGVKDGWKCAG